MIPKYESQSLSPPLAEALRDHLGISAGAQVTSPAEAAEFLRSCQIAALWGGTELPTLHEAVGGELVPRMALVSSSAIGKSWVWTKTLVASGEFVLVKLFRRRATFVARPLWPALASLSPQDLEKTWHAGELSTAARQIAHFLRERGPQNTLELQESLPHRFPILPGSLKKGLEELQEKLVIYPQRVGDHHDGKDINTWELLPRGLAINPPDARREAVQESVMFLVEAAVRAAGVVDARESSRWFPAWKHETREALSTLLVQGRVRPASESAPNQLAWAALLQRTPEPEKMLVQMPLICN